ncbi:MAG: hypothetical protein WCY67_06695 [Acidithiobacillus sp.]
MSVAQHNPGTSLPQRSRWLLDNMGLRVTALHYPGLQQWGSIPALLSILSNAVGISFGVLVVAGNLSSWPETRRWRELSLTDPLFWLIVKSNL